MVERLYLFKDKEFPIYIIMLFVFSQNDITISLLTTELQDSILNVHFNKYYTNNTLFLPEKLFTDTVLQLFSSYVKIFAVTTLTRQCRPNAIISVDCYGINVYIYTLKKSGSFNWEKAECLHCTTYGYDRKIY